MLQLNIRYIVADGFSQGYIPEFFARGGDDAVLQLKIILRALISPKFLILLNGKKNKTGSGNNSGKYPGVPPKPCKANLDFGENRTTWLT